jgi:hypothetical protein
MSTCDAGQVSVCTLAGSHASKTGVSQYENSVVPGRHPTRSEIAQVAHTMHTSRVHSSARFPALRFPLRMDL